MLEVFKDLRLKFIPHSWSSSPEIEVYENAADIPELDVNRSGQHMSVNYIITEENAEVRTVGNEFADGSIGYRVEIAGCEAPALRFSPSGFTPDGKCLVHGIIDFLDENNAYKMLYKELRSRISKDFKSYSGWWIGEEASKYIGKVRFVTISSSSPEIYDLKTEDK